MAMSFKELLLYVIKLCVTVTWQLMAWGSAARLQKNHE